jgi:hypothetical protein
MHFCFIVIATGAVDVMCLYRNQIALIVVTTARVVVVFLLLLLRR